MESLANDEIFPREGRQCTEVRNGRFSSGGGILSQLQWYQSDIQKLGFPKYEIKDN